jgi:uncharacterized membrane protein
MEASTPLPKHAPSAAPRSGDLDAARGAAMVLVCLSHFTSAFFPSTDLPGPRQWLGIITLVASPTFVLLSGILLGWRFRIAPERFARFRARLLDRAIFLLTIGHLAIEGSQLRRMAVAGEQPMFFVLTDVIAIALLVGPPIVVRLAIRGRLAVAALLFATSWGLILGWTPHGDVARVVKAVLVGLRMAEGDIGGYCVPVLPWLGVYVAATCVGHMLAGRSGGKGLLDCPLLWRAGLAAVSIAILQRLLVLDTVGSHVGERLTMLSVTWQKVPPGPTYLLFNGGAGLMMVALLAQLRQASVGEAATRWLELLGRNSAIVFIAQFYVYSMLVPMLRPEVQVAWPVAFATTGALLVLFAWSWERLGLERLLTVQPMLQVIPTRTMRATLAVGLSAITLLLSAHADLLVRPRWNALRAAVTAIESGSHRHL